MLLIILSIYPEVQLLGCIVSFFFHLHHIVAHICCKIIHSHNAKGFPFHQMLANIFCCWFVFVCLYFDNHFPNGCNNESHCGFDLHFPKDNWCLISVLVILVKFYNSFDKGLFICYMPLKHRFIIIFMHLSEK